MNTVRKGTSSISLVGCREMSETLGGRVKEFVTCFEGCKMALCNMRITPYNGINNSMCHFNVYGLMPNRSYSDTVMQTGKCSVVLTRNRF